MSDPAWVQKRVRLLVIANADMHQAAAAAELLSTYEFPSHLSGALETAIAVCYARPFLPSNTLGCLSAKKYAPPDEREKALHEFLLTVRHKLYAHTDADWGRTFGFMPPDESNPAGFQEHRKEFRPEILPEIVELCGGQGQRFYKEAEELDMGWPFPGEA